MPLSRNSCHLHGFFDPAWYGDISDLVSLAIDAPCFGGDVDLLDDVGIKALALSEHRVQRDLADFGPGVGIGKWFIWGSRRKTESHHIFPVAMTD